MQEQRHDRYGNLAWSARWNDAGHLQCATLRRPTGEYVQLVPRVGSHPVLGPCDAVVENDVELAYFASVDWSNPTRIPALNDPTKLPAGAGAAVLNLLAHRAVQRGVERMRYVGPYPTAALFDALLRSFDVVGDTHEAREQFTAEVESLSLRGESKEIPVDFAPRPFAWHWPNAQACLEEREGMQRMFIGGIDFARNGQTRQLRTHGTAVQAEVWLARQRWAVVARLSDGKLETCKLPPADNHLVGVELPEEVSTIVTSVLESRAPQLLRPMLKATMAGATLKFADTGCQLARWQDDVLELHAVLGERLPSLGNDGMLQCLVEATEPVIQARARAQLAAQMAG